MLISEKKNAGGPTWNRATSKKTTHAYVEFTCFYTNLKKSLFLKKLDFDGNDQIEIKQMMKPKMVPMVPRNIVYIVD